MATEAREPDARGCDGRGPSAADERSLASNPASDLGSPPDMQAGVEAGEPVAVDSGADESGVRMFVGDLTVDRDIDFDEFFRAHHGDVVRALALTLGDATLGRDAAAEGFARALQKWRRVSRYDNPAGWVYRVGLNWARSRYRKTQREVAESAATGANEPHTTMADIDPRVRPALKALSVDHRAVIVGRFYLDWSEAQLADALGVKPGTVKSRLSRALAELATALGPN